MNNYDKEYPELNLTGRKFIKGTPVADGSYKEPFEFYKRYLTRGGFIQDRNGKWCKDGDRVRLLSLPYGSAVNLKLYPDVLVLKWEKESGRFVLCDEKNYFSGNGVNDIELVESCEPDICKNFSQKTE